MELANKLREYLKKIEARIVDAEDNRRCFKQKRDWGQEAYWHGVSATCEKMQQELYALVGRYDPDDQDSSK